MNRPTSRQKYVTGNSKGVNRRVSVSAATAKRQTSTNSGAVRVVNDPRMSQLTESFNAILRRNTSGRGGR